MECSALLDFSFPIQIDFCNAKYFLFKKKLQKCVKYNVLINLY